MKELAEQEAKTDTLNKELTTLLNDMKSIHEQKKITINTIKEKNKKWDTLQRQKDETTARFDQLRKQDESLHAELVETNKRRKANMGSIKTVIFRSDYYNKTIIDIKLHINFNQIIKNQYSFSDELTEY